MKKLFKKNIIILALLLVSLVAVSAVNAADNASETVGDGTGSFDELDELINDESSLEINLDKDYIHDSEWEDDCIYISEGQIIDGKGHVIDGNRHSRIFYSSDDNIQVKNLVIKNTKDSKESYYGPIYFEGKNCILDNCTFINNKGDFNIVEIHGKGTIIKNCKFINNNANCLIDVYGNGLTLSSCDFIGNTVGTAIYGDGNSANIENCNLNDNIGSLIRLSEKAVLSNCNFNNNKLEAEWELFIEVSKNSIIRNCNFNKFKFNPDEEDDIIRLCDGDCSVFDCNFTGNDVRHCIGVNYDTGKDTISNCNFENNHWDSFAYTNEYTIVKNLKFNNNEVRYSIFTYFSGAIVNHQYVLGVSYVDSNGIGLSNQKVKYTVGGKSYEKTTDKYGSIEIVYKKFGSSKIVLTNPVTKEKLTTTATLYKVFDKNKDVTKYYKSSTTYKVRVFNYKGKLAVGAQVRFNMGYKTFYSKVDKKGYATLKLNQKPGKYTVSVKYADYYVLNKITIKSTIITKDINKKVKKSGNFKVKILNGKGKSYAKQLVKVNLKGKIYKIKTNKNGIATFKIPKNLKKGKYTIKTTYNGYTVSNKLTVK